MKIGSLVLPTMAIVATTNAQNLRVWTGVSGGASNYQCSGDNRILLASDFGRCFDTQVIACWQVLGSGPATLSLFTGSGCSGQALFEPLGGPIGTPRSQFKTYHSYRFNQIGKREENATEDVPNVERSAENGHLVERRQAGNPSGQRIEYRGRSWTLGQFIRGAPAHFASISQAVISRIATELASGDDYIEEDLGGGNELVVQTWDPVPATGEEVPQPVLQQMWRLAANYANEIGIWKWQIGVSLDGRNTLGVLQAGEEP